jgi:hypothetical protein
MHCANILALLMLAGCAPLKPAPAPSLPPPAPAAATEPVSPPPAPAAAPEPRPSAARVAVDDTTRDVTQPANAAQSPSAAKTLSAKRSRPKTSPPASVAAAAPAPAPAAPAPKATLDFKTLVERLRNTSAIGVFTKLSVKNQVDDLLGDFRGYYAGKVPPTLDDLHERYDGLVLKVVTLIQDGDAALASAISASRSAIWERLSNRESFQAI